MNEPFTEDEAEIMELLILANKKLIELGNTNDTEIMQWNDGIHKCQNVLIYKIVQRDYPKKFRQ